MSASMNQTVDEAHKHQGHGGGFSTVITITLDTLDQTTSIGTSICCYITSRSSKLPEIN